MYLNLGQSVVVRTRDILGIFDLDNASWAFKTREMLQRAEQEGRVTSIGRDLPRTMVLTQSGNGPVQVYLSPLSSPVLGSRAERNSLD